MKRIIVKVLVAYMALNVVLAVLFVSAGGLQMLSGLTLPDYASPPSITSDAEYLQAVVLNNERDFTPAQRQEFIKIIDNAEGLVDADGLTLLASRALAVFDNAHTTVLSPKMSRLPLRFHWTSDALIIVKTQAEYQHLLGHRVLHLGGKTPEEMLSRISEVVGGGTANWRRYRSEYFYSAPSALQILGAKVDDRVVEVRTLAPNGESATVMLAADNKPMPGDPFWDFLDAFPDDTSFNTEGWVSLLRKDQELPLYLQESEKLHLLRGVPEHDALYLRMNGSFNDQFTTVDELKRQALEQISVNQVKNIIVDFRHNRGGDYTEVIPLVKAVSEAVGDDGRIYLIVGPNTFSAGIIASSQFKRYVPDQLVVVGSEMGDKLRFRAEGLYPTLPHSEIQLYLTKAWTDLVDGCAWFDNCWLPNKIYLRKIGSLAIDIPVANTWESYRAGTDLIMSAVFDDIIARPEKNTAEVD